MDLFLSSLFSSKRSTYVTDEVKECLYNRGYGDCVLQDNRIDPQCTKLQQFLQVLEECKRCKEFLSRTVKN